MTITLQYVASTNPAVADLRVVGDMPTLTGSDKQVAWADAIRAKRAREAGVLVAQALKQRDFTFSEFAAEQSAEILTAITADQMGTKMLAILGRVFAKADAKYWIDGRDSSVNTLIHNASKEV